MSDRPFTNPRQYTMLWWAIHKQAYKSRTRPEFIERTIQFLEFIMEFLPCAECNGHINEYNTKYPVREAEDLFIWTFNAHHNANIITGNKQITLQEAEKIYSDDTLCKDCHSEGKKINEGEFIFGNPTWFSGGTVVSSGKPIQKELEEQISLPDEEIVILTSGDRHS